MRNCGKARRARKAIMLDNSVGESIIEVVGGEDTALLRSNPSARTDAGIAAEGYSLKCLPPPVRSNDPGHKAANLGVWGGAPIQKTVFSACPACHLARSGGHQPTAQQVNTRQVVSSHVAISFGRSRFTITDTCGGVSVDDAGKRVFPLGNPTEQKRQAGWGAADEHRVHPC